MATTTKLVDDRCPACGSRDIDANTWEAWCFDCGWGCTKDADPTQYNVIRERQQNEMQMMVQRHREIGHKPDCWIEVKAAGGVPTGRTVCKWNGDEKEGSEQ